MWTSFKMNEDPCFISPFFSTEFCLPGHTAYNRKCYKVYTSGKSFNEAEELCNKLTNGHLATYHSEQDYNFLRDLAQ